MANLARELDKPPTPEVCAARKATLAPLRSLLDIFSVTKRLKARTQEIQETRNKFPQRHICIHIAMVCILSLSINIYIHKHGTHISYIYICTYYTHCENFTYFHVAHMHMYTYIIS